MSAAIPSAPRTPQQKRSQETLRKILAGALEALSRKDLADLSSEDIARAAGVSVGVLYTRFKSKDDLVAYLLADVQERQLAQLRIELAAERWTGADLQARLDWLVERLTLAARERPGLIRAIFSSLMAARPGAQLPGTVEANGEAARLIGAWLVDSGEVRAPDPGLAAEMTAAWLSYSVHLAELYPFAFPGVPTERAAAELKRTALASLRG